MGDNPLAKARGLSPHIGTQTMVYSHYKDYRFIQEKVMEYQSCGKPDKVSRKLKGQKKINVISNAEYMFAKKKMEVNALLDII